MVSQNNNIINFKKMVKIAVFALCALVILQGAYAKPKAKAQPAKQNEQSTLEELAANAQQVVNNVTQSLGLTDLPDSKKVIDDLKTNAQNLANHVNEIVEKLKSEIKAHQPEVENVIKSVEQKLSETATTLQNAAGPEATAKAKELKDNLNSGLKNTVAQVEKLAKAIEPDATKVKTDVQNAAKNLLDQVLQISNDLSSQLQKTYEEHEKSHKH